LVHALPLRLGRWPPVRLLSNAVVVSWRRPRIAITGSSMAISVRNARGVSVEVSLDSASIALAQVELEYVDGAARQPLLAARWRREAFGADGTQQVDLAPHLRRGRIYWLWFHAAAVELPSARMHFSLRVDGRVQRTVALSGDTRCSSEAICYLVLRT
jgi:hypothetical protein